jgi:hypothetical protein
MLWIELIGTHHILPGALIVGSALGLGLLLYALCNMAADPEVQP